jgi:hypothetical protein
MRLLMQLRVELGRDRRTLIIGQMTAHDVLGDHVGNRFLLGCRRLRDRGMPVLVKLRQVPTSPCNQIPERIPAVSLSKSILSPGKEAVAAVQNPAAERHDRFLESFVFDVSGQLVQFRLAQEREQVADRMEL